MAITDERPKMTPERKARILLRAVQAVTLRNAEAAEARRTSEVDPDLLRALELAITSNNIEVIDALLGVRHG